jgi:cell division septum initiation protein DivIVA
MLRQDPPQSEGRNGSADRDHTLDIQRELNRLEELILDSPRIFLTRRTMVDEDEFLDQLDSIRLSLPDAFNQVEEMLQHRDDMIAQAEDYAQRIVAEAQQRAAQLLHESVIVQQAEYEAQQIRSQLQLECSTAQDQTIQEIEQTRRQAQRDLEEIRHLALEESEEIQRGADEYADKVLRDTEAQMSEILRVVRNGRQQLKINQPNPQGAYRGNGSAPQPALPPAAPPTRQPNPRRG